MRNISLWAFHHKRTTRLIFVFIYLALNIVCLFFNEVLLAEGIQIPIYVSYLLAIPFIAAFIFYPNRKEKGRYKNFYASQKTMDGVLFGFSFLLIVCTMNRFSNDRLSISNTGLHAAELSEKPIKPFYKLRIQTKQAAFIVKHWKQLKKNYSLLRQAYRDTTSGEKGLLIALASLVALGLLLLVLALSCNLSCSGSEGAATVVALLGTALVVFLLVKVIQRINRGPGKKKPIETTT